MFCYKCKIKIELPEKKVGFRATCEKCGFDLHICKNCKFYCLGKPNNCLVPNTEPITDPEKYNFCEDFSPSETLQPSPETKKEDVAKHLFKDNDDDDEIKPFDSLFKD